MAFYVKNAVIICSMDSPGGWYLMENSLVNYVLSLFPLENFKSKTEETNGVQYQRNLIK